MECTERLNELVDEYYYHRTLMVNAIRKINNKIKIHPTNYVNHKQVLFKALRKMDKILGELDSKL